MPDAGRVVVFIPCGETGWELPGAVPVDHGWLGGGRRTMHELAVAIACSGRAVEMRGEVHLTALEELAEAAGARPDLPELPRAPAATDTVIVFEGIEDPLLFARLAVSPARVVLLLLAPPGLFGWAFTEGWTLPDPLTVDIAAVARPEHFRGAAALGFELWTNSPGIAAAATAAGLDCCMIGRGRPRLPEPPGRKDVDVLLLENNRWAPLARPVAGDLAARGIRTEAVGSVGHAAMLERIGRARTLIHPMRVEGNSRIAHEARLLGTVPVVLDSNPFSAGMDAASGTVAVASTEDMTGAVATLLADPRRLDGLAAAGRESARAEVEWGPYVERVDAALATPRDDPGRAARAGIGTALREAHAGMLAGLDRHRAWLESTNASRSWRLTAPLRAAKRRLRSGG